MHSAYGLECCIYGVLEGRRRRRFCFDFDDRSE
jgi:hypothetical protein